HLPGPLRELLAALAGLGALGGVEEHQGHLGDTEHLLVLRQRLHLRLCLRPADP
ncbi:unnamed protein product, partial [Effrenium voratum]